MLIRILVIIFVVSSHVFVESKADLLENLLYWEDESSGSDSSSGATTNDESDARSGGNSDSNSGHISLVISNESDDKSDDSSGGVSLISYSESDDNNSGYNNQKDTTPKPVLHKPSTLSKESEQSKPNSIPVHPVRAESKEYVKPTPVPSKPKETIQPVVKPPPPASVPIQPVQSIQPIQPVQPLKPVKGFNYNQNLLVRPPRPSQNILDDNTNECKGGRKCMNKCIEDVWSYRVDVSRHGNIPEDTWIQRASKEEAWTLMMNTKHMFKNTEVWILRNLKHNLSVRLRNVPILRGSLLNHKPRFILMNSIPFTVYFDSIQVKSVQFLQNWNVTNSIDNYPSSPSTMYFECYKRGYYPNYHSTTCTEYVVCDNTLQGLLYPSFLNCPSNNYFDPNLKICSKKYKCRV